MTRSIALATLLLSSSGLLAACGATRGAPEARLLEIQELTRDQQYGAAASRSVDLLEDLPADHPLRPQAVQAQRDVSLASGLEIVRRLTLADEDDEALAVLADLEEAFPGSNVVAAWRERTERKLADRWFEIAREALANEHFEAAREAYKKAIEYEPDHPVAPAGLARLGLVEEYRAGLAEDYYYDGVRGFTDLRLAESDNSFEKSRKYDEEDARTKQRIDEVRREQAKARVAYAETLVADRRYAAARAEYAEAARLDPTSDAIAEQLAAMRVESSVAATISEAESFILRQDFDKGEALLREAAERTELQSDVVAAALSTIDDQRIEAEYQRALDLAHDFRFPEALVGYEAILESRDFYKDVRARLDACREVIATSERLYAEAEAESDDAKKLELYRRIELIWPDYSDIPERIKALDDGR